jgi:hypothetical protein
MNHKNEPKNIERKRRSKSFAFARAYMIYILLKRNFFNGAYAYRLNFKILSIVIIKITVENFPRLTHRHTFNEQ